MKEPPLGIMSTKLWKGKQDAALVLAKRLRAIELSKTILRNLNEEQPVPREWTGELHELICEGAHGR